MLTDPASADARAWRCVPCISTSCAFTEELGRYQYHTDIAALMEYGNWIGANRDAFTPDKRAEALRTLVLMLAPSHHSWRKSCGSGS